MNNLYKIIVLIVLVLLLKQYHHSTQVIDTIKPKPVVVPTVVIENHVIINDYGLALELSKKTHKPLLVIIKANWCRFCKKLEKDIEKLNIKPKFIICLLDIDHNKDLTKAFEIKNIPTSIIIDCSGEKNIEISRKKGYVYEDYLNWIKSLSVHTNDN